MNLRRAAAAAAVVTRPSSLNGSTLPDLTSADRGTCLFPARKLEDMLFNSDDFQAMSDFLFLSVVEMSRSARSIWDRISYNPFAPKGPMPITLLVS